MGRKVRLRPDRCRQCVVPLNHAIPLCLIVNEVLSNAFKHGFPKAARARS